MKSILIRTSEDFNKIDEETDELEFVEYEDSFEFTEDCFLPKITFTKMDVFLEYLPLSLEKIFLFDCDAEFGMLKMFPKLKFLAITNRELNINDLVGIDNLEELSLNYCSVDNVERLKEFSRLNRLSIVNTDISNYEFLFDLEAIKTIVVDEDNFEKNKELFIELSKKDILILDMMGGCYNEI